jgi:hypothetical protein
MQTSRVRHFDSTTPEYTRAFQLFLSHTDQKEKTMEWLDQQVEALPLYWFSENWKFAF